MVVFISSPIFQCSILIGLGSALIIRCSRQGMSLFVLLLAEAIGFSLNTDVFVSLACHDGNCYDSDVSLSAIFCSRLQHVRYSSNQFLSTLTVVYVILVHQTQMMTKSLGIVVWCRKLKILPSYAYLLTDRRRWRYTWHMRSIQCRRWTTVAHIPTSHANLTSMTK